jgi:chromosome partitioning protein
LLHIQAEFRKHDIRAFRTQIHEREAYRALFSFGGTLESLDPRQVSNLPAAVTNAREFAAEVVAMLRAVPEDSLQKTGVA